MDGIFGPSLFGANSECQSAYALPVRLCLGVCACLTTFAEVASSSLKTVHNREISRLPCPSYASKSDVSIKGKARIVASLPAVVVPLAPFLHSTSYHAACQCHVRQLLVVIRSRGPVTRGWSGRRSGAEETETYRHCASV